ncbi:MULTISPECIES: hypothetical protein [Rhodonellum]|uniref:hypothetical protein n=1 Tax=Rhodonellum TaxID=336827 RepID=UPI0011146CF9|nr:MULTISPECIES: hypothetical protein [Rhodonellum]
MNNSGQFENICNIGLFNPKYVMGFPIGVEAAKKSDHLGSRAWCQNGEVKNSKQKTGYDVFLGWNGIGNA